MNFEPVDLIPNQRVQPAGHFIKMVSIRTLPDTASTHSSTGSVPTEVLHPEDEDYDMDLPPYPPGFSRFLVFPPRRGDLVLNVSIDSQYSTGRPTIKDNNTNSATPTAPSGEHMRKNNRGN